MTKLTKEQNIEKQMRLFHLTRAEATKVVEDDMLIDSGGICDWEQPLTKEQKANMRKARSADRTKPTTKIVREKKVNNSKVEIISKLTETLESMGASNIAIINNERELAFNYNDTRYKIVLSVPRI